MKEAPPALPPRWGSSALVLVAANLLPIAGYFFLGWRLFDVLLLYWIENVIIGVLNVPKIILFLRTHVRPEDVTGSPKMIFIGMPVFFVLHYGLFTAAHGAVIIGLFSPAWGQFPVDGPEAGGLRDALGRAWLGIAGLVASHGYSFVANFLLKREYRDPRQGGQVMFPYSRVLLMQIVVIFGAFGAALLDRGAIAVVILIGSKTVADLYAHRRQRDPKPPRGRKAADGGASSKERRTAHGGHVLGHGEGPTTATGGARPRDGHVETGARVEPDRDAR